MSTAPTPAVHEKGLSLFVDPKYRNRFRESFVSPRRRDKLRRKLAHFAQLDSRFTSEIEGSTLESALRERGAPERCYLLSENTELDGRDMLLSDAVAATVDAESAQATFISCIPGKLAYFHGEDRENRHLLERTE